MAYEARVGSAYARGCRRSLLILIGGGLLGVLMVGTVLWVAGGRDARPGTWGAVLAPLVPLPVLGLTLLVAWFFVRRRGKRLDRAFAGWDLAGHQVGGVLRGWHGEIHGRAFDAWFSKGPTLELYLGCKPATRGAIHRAGRFLRRVAKVMTTREPLDPVPPEARDCQVYAEDGEWMRRWLAHPGVEESLHLLLRETERVSPVLMVAPDALRYSRRFLPMDEWTAANLEAWVGEMETLAAAVDAVGPSASGVEASATDRWGRLRRGRKVMPIFFGCLGLVTLVVLAGVYAVYYAKHGF